MITLGNKDLSGIYLGEVPVKSIYLGTAYVFGDTISGISDNLSITTENGSGSGSQYITMPRYGGDTDVTVSASSPWSCTVDPSIDWLSIERNNNVVTITASYNSDNETRSGEVYFQLLSSERVVTVYITQSN